MEITSRLKAVNDKGWKMGFANLFHEANESWWHTKKWLVQSIVWLFLMNIIIAGIWKVSSEIMPGVLVSLRNMASMMDLVMHPFGNSLVTYFIICQLGLPMAAIIAGQDAFIGERQSGTAAWVLSKPVSRAAFILSKLAASSIGLFVTGVLIQGVGVYAQLSSRTGSLWPIAGFMGAMGMLFLNVLFYLTLSYMLGAFFTNRGAVLGISLAAALGGPLMLRGLPIIKELTPWGFFYNTGNEMPQGLALALGQPLVSYLPILGTALMCLLFTAVTLWRFRREEF